VKEEGIVDIYSRTVLQEGNTTLGFAMYPDYLILPPEFFLFLSLNSGEHNKTP